MLKDSLICIRQTKPTQVSNIFRSQLKLVDVSGSSQIQTMTGSKGCLNVPYPPTADNDGHTSFELFLSVESCQNNLQTLFTDITKTGENDYHREESVSQQPKPSNWLSNLKGLLRLALWRSRSLHKFSNVTLRQRSIATWAVHQIEVYEWTLSFSYWLMRCRKQNAQTPILGHCLSLNRDATVMAQWPIREEVLLTLLDRKTPPREIELGSSLYTERAWLSPCWQGRPVTMLSPVLWSRQRKPVIRTVTQSSCQLQGQAYYGRECQVRLANGRFLS